MGCRNCGKKLKTKSIYCSNKGPGNCKDAWHNRNNPRGYGLGRHNNIEELIHDEASAANEMGWDGHKDTF